MSYTSGMPLEALQLMGSMAASHAMISFLLGVATGLGMTWIALKVFTKMPPPRE